MLFISIVYPLSSLFSLSTTLIMSLIEKLKRPSTEIRNLVTKYSSEKTQPKILYIKIEPFNGSSTIHYDNDTTVIYHNNGEPTESIISSTPTSPTPINDVITIDDNLSNVIGTMSLQIE